MALTEQKILASVDIQPKTSTVQVRWDNLVLRDGEIISRVPHRKAYMQEQKAEFLVEVEGAAAYVTAMGW
jgi:hypothetical protein